MQDGDPVSAGTTDVKLELLSSGTRSQVASGAQGVALLDTVATLVITVPAGVPDTTPYAKVIWAAAPAGRESTVHVNTPATGVPHVNPRFVSSIAEVNVVLAGTVSLSTTLWAVSGPLLLTNSLNTLPEPDPTSDSPTVVDW